MDYKRPMLPFVFRVIATSIIVTNGDTRNELIRAENKFIPNVGARSSKN
jgi:hypothetical protein